MTLGNKVIARINDAIFTKMQSAISDKGFTKSEIIRLALEEFLKDFDDA